MERTLLTCLGLALASAITAQTLDPTFGNAGVVLQDAGRSDIIRDIALQPDGKIVATGWAYDATNTDLLIARFNSDGSLDNTFGTNGVRIRPTGSGFSGAEAVAVQSDGKIVAGGYSNNGVTNGFAVWRFNSDGTDDASFAGGSPFFNTITASGGYINDLVLQPDGKIVVTGSAFSGTLAGAGIVRLTTVGALDASFNGTGIRLVEGFAVNYSSTANAIALQPDGKILAAGSFRNVGSATATNDAQCIRVNTDGSMDLLFGSGGISLNVVPGYEEYAYAIAVQSDGRIAMTGDGQTTGASDWNVLIERLTAAGVPDPALGTNAILWNPSGVAEYARSLNVQPDGKYLVAGSSVGPFGAEAFLTRITTSGMGEFGFGINGYQSADFGDWTYAEAALIQPDGMYVIAGNSASGGLPYDMMLARYDVGISPLAVEAFADAPIVSLYPDPSDGRVTIDAGRAMIERVEIIDMQGRVLRTVTAVTGSRILDLTELGPGSYAMRASFNGKVTYLHFILN